MREIKFRAWFKNEGEMKNVAINNVYEGNKTYLHLSPMPMSDYKAIELMQYTGLKDKNGREVYEGDLYQYTSTSEIGLGSKIIKTSEITRIKPIVFEEGAFYHGHDLLADVIEYDDTFTYVGNIYENPELLEVNK